MKRAIIFTMLLLPMLSLSQIDQMRDRLNDEVKNMEEGVLTLRFIDAVTGDPVREATVSIEEFGEFTTDGQGRVMFKNPEQDGVYAFSFQKEKYLPLHTTFEIVAGTIFYNRIAVSPAIAIENLRIVLEWGRRPADLDAHLEKRGGYHISYRNKSVSADGEAKLDRDDTDQYGPETITIQKVAANKKYRYFVEDFTNRSDKRSKKLSKSSALVRLYDHEGLVKEWRLKDKEKGNMWNVFEIVRGKVISIDEITTK